MAIFCLTWIFTLSLSLILLPVSTSAQYHYSSIEAMKSLPPLQANMLSQLETLVAKMRDDLAVINATRQTLKTIKLKPMKNKIDMFIYLNKLVTFRKHVKSKYKLSLDANELPTAADVDGNLFSLIVLQSTYNLDINELVRGYIRTQNGLHHTKLDLLNQLMILTTYYDVHESHVHPIEALHETSLTVNVQNYTQQELVIIGGMYKAISKKLITKHRGYVLKLFHKIITHFTGNNEDENNKAFINIFLNINNELIEHNLEDILISNNEGTNHPAWELKKPTSKWNPYKDNPHVEISLDKYRHYSKLCQGEHLSTSKRPLTCYFSTQDNVYYLLRPFKIEQLCLDPLVLVFREFADDSEIQMLIQAGRRQGLMKSWIGQEGKAYDSILRISHNTWLDPLAPELEGFARRVVSALPLADEAEAIQINNYGTGGLYTVHLDNFYQKGNPNLSDDRLATFMLYLSDVDSGGATVFPRLNLTFFPQRGSAIFWHNLYSNLSTDYRTLHAGCPVVLGDKWVANKWYSSRGQLFHYPCKGNETVVGLDEVKRVFSHY
uniref:procollagen-proline 4-dioxygenase n=1 Tax=Cacopsylla melanoneura TaxID=428564 RepID=A0A8D8T3L3_9HEMI